ncbi:MAG: phosphoglycerate kinase [Chitinivibrionales bacterium]|nr:phosphoglycerate kinase [Chitinivibrionales bacterium]
MSKKLFIEDLQVKGKQVLVRVDFNVPLDDNMKITNDKRIAASLSTINYLCEQGAKVILMSHLGRPKGERKPEFSLKPVADDLSSRLQNKVSFIDDCIGDKVEAAVSSLNDGDILLLENLRFYKEEEKNDASFAEKLAKPGEIYVNDAFGSAHRAHASTQGVTKYIDKCAAGYLMKKELDYLGKALESPEHPFIAILGGAKISGKIDVISNLLNKVDKLLVGGGMMFTFYKAQDKEIGKSLLEEDKLALAKETLGKAGEKMVLPVDCVAAPEFSNDSPSQTVSVDAIPSDLRGLDIGPQTIELFKKELAGAKTVVWNGPMGVFEFDNFAAGTNAIAEVLAECTDTGAITIIGGGDSASAAKKAGVAGRISHISTGGGASLEFLEGKTLPGVAALSEK